MNSVLIGISIANGQIYIANLNEQLTSGSFVNFTIQSALFLETCVNLFLNGRTGRGIWSILTTDNF